MVQTWNSKEWKSEDGLSPRWGSPNLAANGRKPRAESTMSYQDWIFSGFIYLVTILCVIIWVSTTAIQDIIVIVFSTCVQQQRRSLRNMGHPPSFRRICNGFSSNQSARRYCSTQKSLLWAPHFDHLVTRSGLRQTVPISAIYEGLYCAKGNRLYQYPRNRHRHHRHHKTLIESHIENRSRQTVQQSLGNQPSQQDHRIQISQLNEFIQKQMSERSGSSGSPPATPITVHAVVGIMPRPGQPGALGPFDGTRVTEFLKNWDLECEEYGLSERLKCKKLPKYCNKEIEDVIQDMKGYETGNWELLQKELKELFWQADPPKNTVAALCRLISDAKSGRMNVDMYVLKYTTITEALLKKNAISSFDRTVRLLEGLPEDLQKKVFEYCSGKKWRMLEHDVETVEPEFDEVKSVVLEKARTLERQKLFIQGQLMGPGYMGSEPITPATSTTTSSVPTTMTSPVSTAVDSDGVNELTKRIERLTLLVEGRPQRPVTDNVPASTSAPVAMGRRCLWCDSLEHVRRDCVEFTEALRSNLVRFNDAGRVVLVSTGQELPLMIGKGGMKRLVQLIVGSAKTRPLATASAVETTAKGSSGAVRVITVDDQSFREGLEGEANFCQVLSKDELETLVGTLYKRKDGKILRVNTSKSLGRVSLHDYRLNAIRHTGVLFYSMDGWIFGKSLVRVSLTTTIIGMRYRHADVLFILMDRWIFGESLVRVSLHDYRLNAIRHTGVLFYSMDGSIFGKIPGKGQPPRLSFECDSTYGRIVLFDGRIDIRDPWEGSASTTIV